MAIRQTVGNAVDIIGTLGRIGDLKFLGPLNPFKYDFQLSEAIAGGNTKYTNTGATYLQYPQRAKQVTLGAETQAPPQTENTQTSGTGTSGTGTNRTTSSYTPSYSYNPTQNTNETAYGGNDINSIYDQAYAMYDRLQNNYNSRLNDQNYFKQFTQPYDAQIEQTEALIPQAEQTYNVQREQELANRESALDAAYRLYNEMSQGVRQRFGGSTSAGDFANQFYGRELQRQQGDVYKTSGQNIQKLVQKLQSDKEKISAQIQNIRAQRVQAENEARMNLMDKIDQINSQKAMLGESKAQAKIAALQDYRNKVYELNNYASQFEANLLSQAAEADKSLSSLVAKLRTEVTSPTSVNPYRRAAFSMLNGGQSVDPTELNQYTGGYARRPEDQVL